MEGHNLEDLKRAVDQLVVTVYGDRYGNEPGLKRRIERINELYEIEKKQRDRLYEELAREREAREREQAARQLEEARRQGAAGHRSDLWRTAKWAASLLGGGTILAVIGAVYRAIGGE